MKHKSNRPAAASGKLASNTVLIKNVKVSENLPEHWLMIWHETNKMEGGEPVACGRTANSRADLRTFAKTKLKATHFNDGDSSTRPIKL